MFDEKILWSAAPKDQPEGEDPYERRGHERAKDVQAAGGNAVLAECQNPDCGWRGNVTPDKLNTPSCPECGTGMLAEVSE